MDGIFDKWFKVGSGSDEASHKQSSEIDPQLKEIFVDIFKGLDGKSATQNIQELIKPFNILRKGDSVFVTVVYPGNKPIKVRGRISWGEEGNERDNAIHVKFVKEEKK